MIAKKTAGIIALFLALGLSGWARAPKKVGGLPSHNLQGFCWMPLAEVVPRVTDRLILPMGTVKPQGACLEAVKRWEVMEGWKK